ncbi:unnamed protein product [Prunus armeniaca]
MTIVNNLRKGMYCWKKWSGAGSYVRCSRDWRSRGKYCWKKWSDAGSYVRSARDWRSRGKNCWKCRRGAGSYAGALGIGEIGGGTARSGGEASAAMSGVHRLGEE